MSNLHASNFFLCWTEFYRACKDTEEKKSKPDLISQDPDLKLCFCFGCKGVFIQFLQSR